jgi:hypothetical protein
VINPLRTVRRRTLLIASGTAVVLAVGGGTAAMAATSDGTPTPSTSPAACAVHLRAELRGAMPSALKADLKTLRGEKTKAAKVAERKVIRQKALSGAYGARAEELAKTFPGHRKAVQAWRKDLPAALKADLKTLRATAPHSAARAAERKTISDKALAGGYGTTIQQHAKTVQARFQKACAAKSGS